MFALTKVIEHSFIKKRNASQLHDELLGGVFPPLLAKEVKSNKFPR